jgi:dUTP pyrophosphatase
MKEYKNKYYFTIMKVLRLCIDPDSDSTLMEYYQNKMKEHNSSYDSSHQNSGFDLASPLSIQVESDTIVKLDFKVRGAMYEDDVPIAYYLYARSSIVKTGFRLANSVGIIDSGYRGNLMAYFDIIKNDRVDIYQRLVQICAPDLKPFKVEIVDSLDDTERGDGGFGSTGV